MAVPGDRGGRAWGILVAAPGEKRWPPVGRSSCPLTRAKSAPDEAGVLPEFAGVMVHDRLAMYFKYDKATHAICLAHVLRELGLS